MAGFGSGELHGLAFFSDVRLCFEVRISGWLPRVINIAKHMFYCIMNARIIGKLDRGFEMV